MNFILFSFCVVGLQYDNIAKKLDTTAKTEGLHLGPPGFSFIIFPSVFQTLRFKDITVSVEINLSKLFL